MEVGEDELQKSLCKTEMECDRDLVTGNYYFFLI